MRLVSALLLFGLLAACSGDSSSIMSTWNDDTGGAGGSAAGGQGGSPGLGGSGGVTTTIPSGGTAGVVAVQGGARDGMNAQCVATSSGGGCPVGGAFLGCLQGSCAEALRKAYQGTSGPCAAYAACMFNCPCDSGRSGCELTCFNDKGIGDETCSPRLLELLTCLSMDGCAQPTCLIN